MSLPRRFAITPNRSVCVIVLLGAGLRLFPIWFGLPYLGARPDEEVAVARAVAILGGDPNPHFFHWPSLTFYLFAALYAPASVIRRALFLDPALTDVERFVIARTCVALAGTLTIVVLFRLARRVADATTGVIASAFLAVSILHVRESHFAMSDVLMTLLVTASLALLVRALDALPVAGPLDHRAVRSLAAAGLVGGLAASTKYSAAAIVAGMGAVQWLWLRQSRETVWRAPAWRLPVVFLAAFGCGFILATPYALFDAQRFAVDLRFDFDHLAGGHVVDLGRGWSYHLIRSLPYGVGVPMFVAALAGLVPTTRHYGRRAFVVGAFAAAFYASVGRGYTVFFRYVLPLVPIVCILAAVAVRHAASWMAPRTGLSNRAAVALLTALVAGPTLVNSAWFDALLAKTDTRVLAARWLTARVNEEESLFEAGGYYPQLDLAGARFHRWSSFDPATRGFGDPEGRMPDWLVFEESPLWTYAVVAPELRQLALEKYLLASIVRGTKGRVTDGGTTAVYDLQDAFFMPIDGLITVERPGPTVLIYRRRNAPPIAARRDRR